VTETLGATIQTRPYRCPHCDTLLDGATQLMTGESSSHQPEVGDITVCIGCAVVLKFAEGDICTIFPLEELRAAAYDDPASIVALGRAWFAVKRLLAGKQTTIH
jgi:hypothetical protein